MKIDRFLLEIRMMKYWLKSGMVCIVVLLTGLMFFPGSGFALEQPAGVPLKLMPIQFDHGTGDSRRELATGDKLDVSMQLEVDAAAAAALLPTWQGQDGKTYGYRPWPIGPHGKPVLFVNYTQERDVKYMAGGGYNEIEFYMSAEFVGEKEWSYKGEKYDGAYGYVGILLLPSRLIPLIFGREVLGTPKYLADVKNLVLDKLFPEDKSESGWFEALDKHDLAFIAGALRHIVPVPYEVLKQPLPKHEPLPAKKGWGRARRFEPGFKVMLWKYIPSVNWNTGRPDLSYNMAAALAENDEVKDFSQPRAGDGNLIFPHPLKFKDDPAIAAAVKALRQLVEKHGRPFPGNVLIRHYRNAYRAQDMHIMDGPRLPSGSGNH